MAQTVSNALHTSEAWENFASLAAPIARANVLGKHICTNQPDVEVMALVLNDVPLTSEKFGTMDGGRGWVTMAFTVLQVGPPGFSSVPYTANKKEKESNPLRLYETDDNGATRMYPFEKGKTNKDKGIRVSTFASDVPDAVPIDATTVLENGVMMSTFMRGDDFALTGDDKHPKMFVLDSAFDGLDAIPANTVVYMQLSASNIDQAKKNQGLKVRKIKSVSSGDVLLGSCFSSLPFGERAVGNLMDRSRSQHSLSGMLYRHTLRTFAVRPKASAYAVRDDAGYFVLCDADDDISEIRFSEFQLLSLVGTRLSIQDALAVINIALSMEALRVVVTLDTSSVKTLQGDMNHEVAVMELDTNQFLQLNNVASFGTWPCHHTSAAKYPCSDQNQLNVYSHAEHCVSWSNPLHVHTTPRLEKRYIVYHMGKVLEEMECSGEAELEDTMHFLDKGMAGPFIPLDIYITSVDNISNEDLYTHPSTKKVVSLELRPENRKASGGKKRKRLDIAQTDAC